MKTIFLTVALLALNSICMADGPAASTQPATTPALWSNQITCTLSSISYYDFSQVKPFKMIFGSGNNLPGATTTSYDLSIKMTIDETNRLGQGSVKVPGTGFEFDVDEFMFSNSIRGVPTAFKNLSGRIVLRQDGHIVANAELMNFAPASNSTLLISATLQSADAVEGELLADKDHRRQPIYSYVRQVNPNSQIVIDSGEITCIAKAH